MRSPASGTPGPNAAKTTDGGPFRNPSDYSSLPAPDYSLETLARQVDSSISKSIAERTRKSREFVKGLPFEEGRKEQCACLIMDNPSSRLNLDYREAQLERDKEASRPIHQFNYQVARERDRIYQENADNPNSVPQDISTQAYEIVKNRWRVRHIWNEDWGILPGLHWVYEEERYLRYASEAKYNATDEVEDVAAKLYGTRWSSRWSSRGPFSRDEEWGEHGLFSRNQSKRKMPRSKKTKKRSKRNKHQLRSPKPWDEKLKIYDRVHAAMEGIELLVDDPRLPSDFGEFGWMDGEKVDELVRTGQWTNEEIRKNVKEMERIWDGLPPWPLTAAWKGPRWARPLVDQMERNACKRPEETTKFTDEHEKNRVPERGGLFGSNTIASNKFPQIDDPRLPRGWRKAYWLEKDKVDELRRTGQWSEEEIHGNVKALEKIWDELTPWPEDVTWDGTDWLDPLKVQRARLAGVWSEETIKSAVEEEKNGVPQTGGLFGSTVQRQTAYFARQ